MKGKRTWRLIRIASRMLLRPSSPLSLTETAAGFRVSKTLISDDIEIISEALKEEGAGSIVTDRGRSGGAYFVPSVPGSLGLKKLKALTKLLSVPERLLPGGLVYYTDILFKPEWTSFLGLTMASMFMDDKPSVIMTSEVKGIPVALFTAYAMGLPLAVCRFRNRPSDGPAVGVHYPAGNGEVRTMYLGTRSLDHTSNVLIVDDFMKGGSTVYGMQLVVREFGAALSGTGVFISSAKPSQKAVSGYRSLLDLSIEEGIPKLSISK